MARFEIDGIDDLNKAFSGLGNVPESVVSDAVTSMARVAAEKIKASGETMRVRSDEAPHLLDSIKVGKFKKTAAGGYVDVTFSGTQKSSPGAKPVRNDRIAFENEYGNRQQDARPFVTNGLAKNEDLIVAPAAKILGEWADKTFTD